MMSISASFTANYFIHPSPKFSRLSSHIIFLVWPLRQLAGCSPYCCSRARELLWCCICLASLIFFCSPSLKSVRQLKSTYYQSLFHIFNTTITSLTHQFLTAQLRYVRWVVRRLLQESQTNNLLVNQTDARRSTISLVGGSQFNTYIIYQCRRRATRVVRRWQGAQRSRWTIAPVATALMVGVGIGIGIGYTLGYV